MGERDWNQSKNKSHRHDNAVSTGMGNMNTFEPSWTQFSGIPQQGLQDPGNGFAHWGVFSSTPPPVGPSLAELHPEEFIATYNDLMSAMNTNAQSREILPPVDGRSNTPQNVSQEGKDIYTETLDNWNSFPTYDPFKIPESPLVQVQTTESAENAPKSPTSVNRPSYSEIAKSLKTKTLHHQNSRERDDSESQKKKNDAQGKFLKPPSSKKLYIPKQNAKVGTKNADLESKVKPNSKYGLDQFEQLSTGSESGKGTNSPEPDFTRKNSASSISSGTSGIDEIHMVAKSSVRMESSHPSNVRLPPDGSESEDPKPLQSSSPSEKAFFDPKRIFQAKEKKSSNVPSPSLANATLLNNGKPSSMPKNGSAAHRKSSGYINNDLRDVTNKKKTNQVQHSKDDDNKKSENNKRERKSRHTSENSKKKNKNKHNFFNTPSFDQEKIDEWITFGMERVKWAAASFWSFLVTAALLLFGLIIYLVNAAFFVVVFVWDKVVLVLKNKILNKFFPKLASNKRKIGLEENIVLPSTGEEAMQRLLACKGKDPYSILGLRSDATDDDIRKYYRRQAILVHPDKNKQLGAEEAFKILGRAFEMIGEPEKRKDYDLEASDIESVMKDLLTKLQEAANMMRCDNCGGKHKRVPVDRPWYSARFCKRCNTHHSAKEGDVWAETSVFGFYWHYFACMEGQIYDITEWAACKKDFFKHLQAGSHHVFYRIATEGNRGNNNQRHNGEADLEDFINQLFHQAMKTEGGGSNQWKPPPSRQSTGGSSNNHSTQGSASGAKKRQRKKRK